MSGSEILGFRRRTFGILILTMRYVFILIACVLQWKHPVYEEDIENLCGWDRDCRVMHCWCNCQNFHLKTCFSIWTIASTLISVVRGWKISSEKSYRTHFCFQIAASTSSCRAIWTLRTSRHVFQGRPNTQWKKPFTSLP